MQNWTPERTGGPPQFDFQVAYPIDWWLFGKRLANMHAAGQGVKVSEAEVADLVRNRVTDAAVAYYDVLESRALVDVARQDLENYNRVEASLKKAVELGGRPQVDLNRIRLDKLKSAQALRDAEAALEKAKAKLKSLIGFVDAEPGFDVSGNLDLPPEPAEPPSSEEAFVLGQEHRPDIQALRWKVSRAQAEVEVEDRKACPEVKPMVGYTHQFQRKPIGQPDADSYTLALSTSLPWHDKNQGNRMKARSVLAQSHGELRLGLVDLRAEVEQAIVDYQLAVRNSRAIARDQLQLARDVRESISTAYNAGGKTLLDFLDAQRNFRETFRLYNTSRADYWRAVVRLIAATGKQELLHDKPTPSIAAKPRP